MGKCAICLKKLERGTGPFFKVPADDSKRLLWGSNCHMLFRPNDFVCKDHFLSEHMICGGRKARLLPIAVPHIQSMSGTNTNGSPAAKQSVATDSFYAQSDIEFTDLQSPGKYDAGMVSQAGSNFERSYESHSMHVATGCTDLMTLAVTAQDRHTQTTRVLFEESHTQTDCIIFEALVEPEISLLKKEVKKLQDENRDLRRQLMESNAVINNFKRIFTEGQIRKMILPEKKMKWSWKDIASAICLNAAGPRAYSHLYDKGFPLPHVSTLQRWFRKTDISEGLLAASFDALEHMSELCDDDKICVLSFDEMKVVEAFEYDQPGDFVRKPANYVQVVMARGLRKSWKQPVFFAFDCQMTKDILCSIIVALKNVKIPVVAVVCDMGPTNRKLWKELNVTIDDPWFLHPADENTKVFVFADAPHLLKLVRNHFIDNNILWNGHLLSSRTICDVLSHTSKSDVSITFKISHEHLSVKGIGRQKVKLAAQLFSNTTANAIRRCYSLGFELYKPVETADFIQLVNDWFDVLNSNIGTFGYPGKEPFGTALSKQLDVLNRMNEFMSLPIIPNKKGLEVFQKGIIMTNRALVGLFNHVQNNSNVEYLLTYRLNQDVLEHFFGAIRSKGGLNDHPTPKEFQYRLRKYILARNTECLRGRGNVSKDTTEWIVPTEPPKPSKPVNIGSSVASGSTFCEESIRAGGNDDESMPEELVDIEAPDIANPDDCDILQEDALEYVSGYIIKKLNLEEFRSSEASFTWVDQVNKGFLNKPSPCFLQGVKSLEKIFHNINALEISHCKNIHERLVSCSAEVQLPESVKRLFFKCRIHFRIRSLNRRLKIKKAKQRIMGYKKFIKINL